MMKTAVVFGARQPFGFELCTQLLEKGYHVHAVDHEKWITEKQEENWLMIGRNANLYYQELGESHQQIGIDQECLYIIPVVDYLSRQADDVKEQLIFQLNAIAGQTEHKKVTLLLQPASMNRMDSSFIQKMDHIVESLEANNTIIHYSIPYSSEARYAKIMVDEPESGGWETIGETPCHDNYYASVIKDIIDHIEKKQMFYSRT